MDRGLRKSEERTAIDFIGFMMCGAWHSARPADPEHGDHDGHLRAHCLPAQTAALLDEQLEITTFIQQSTLQYHKNVFTLDRVAFVPFLDRPAHSRLSMKRRKKLMRIWARQ